MRDKYLIVAPVIDMTKFNDNLAKSAFFKKNKSVIIKGFANVCEAQNKAMRTFDADYMLFIHEDIFLPDSFEEQLERSIKQLNVGFPNWYVAGPAGVRLKSGETKIYGHCQDRGTEWGHPLTQPVKVQSVTVG